MHEQYPTHPTLTLLICLTFNYSIKQKITCISLNKPVEILNTCKTTIKYNGNFFFVWIFFGCISSESIKSWHEVHDEHCMYPLAVKNLLFSSFQLLSSYVLCFLFSSTAMFEGIFILWKHSNNRSSSALVALLHLSVKQTTQQLTLFICQLIFLGWSRKRVNFHMLKMLSSFQTIYGKLHRTWYFLKYRKGNFLCPMWLVH